MSTIGSYFRRELPSQKFNASFAGGFVFGHAFRFASKEADKSEWVNLSTKGLAASIKTGVEMNDYISKGAVGGGLIAGAILFGPIGAIAGGLIGSTKRKGGTQIYVVVERDGEVIGILEGSARKEGEARKFIAALESSAADLA